MMNKYSIIDNHYRLLEYKGNGGERFGEVWLVEDLDRPGSEPEYMVVSNQRFADKYILIRQLGSGGFGEVWKAKDTVTGVDVALKIHKDSDSIQATNQIVKEYTRVMGIHHDNLLTPTHVNITGGRTAYLEMELCRKDLNDAELTEEEVWKLIRDVASGLKRLAENKKWIEKQQRHIDNPIIHQDIKPENILLRGNGMYAISDFGISKRKLSSLTTNETEPQDNVDSWMTTAYAAPERFPRGVGKSELASDIWSLGAMLYELVEGQLPFYPDLGGNSLNNDTVQIPAITRKDYSDELKQLVYDCMAKEPETRPTAAQLLEYAEKTIAGEVRKVTWAGAPKQIKADPSKRLSQYKGIPWGENVRRSERLKKPKKHKDLGNVMLWIKQNKKPILVIPAICIFVVGGIVALPHITELFNNAERKAWRVAKQENTLASYKAFIENNGQSGYVDAAITNIIRTADVEHNVKGLSYILLYEDSCKSNGIIPNVAPTTVEEVNDSVNVLCARWTSVANNLSLRIGQYTFDRDYSQPSEQEYLAQLVDDALSIDRIWILMDEFFRKCEGDTCRLVTIQMDGVADSIAYTLKNVQNKFTSGKSVLSDGEFYAPKEYKSFYNQAIECIDKYFENRHYSELEVING